MGFREALLILAALVLTALISTSLLMKGDLGTSNKKAKFGQMFSNNRAVNVLAAARVFLFASRDVWFVVGLPVFLYTVLGWTFWQVGGFMAIWIIGYGLVQASAPGLLRRRYEARGGTPDGVTATWLAFMLAAFPAGIALALRAGVDPTLVVVAGLDCLRHRLRPELGRSLVPDPGVHRQRQGGDERRLLLHGQRLRTPGRHDPLGAAVSVLRT